MLTHVFFDLYGTLLDIVTDEEDPATAASFAEWLEGRFGAEAAERERHHPMVRDFRRIVPGPREHAEPDIVPVIAAHLGAVLGRPASPAEVVEAAERFRVCSRRRLAVIPGAREALATLGARFRTGLVSNAQLVFTRPELAESGLLAWLDPVVISSELGVRKPSPLIFAAALARAGARADESLFVGNDPVDDVAGAAAAGLMTCLVGERAAAASPPSVAPDLRLGSVAELPAVLL